MKNKDNDNNLKELDKYLVDEHIKKRLIDSLSRQEVGKKITKENIKEQQRTQSFSATAVDLTEKKEEEKLFHQLVKEKGEAIYTDVIHLITNIKVPSTKTAKKIFKEVMVHKEELDTNLKRDVGLEVAFLDYFKNISKTLETPLIIESEDVEKLSKNAIYDVKTNTYDYSLLTVDIEKEIQRSKRYSSKFSLMFIDIDNFNSINEVYGQAVGDKILTTLADLIKMNLRKSDSVYRYGNDEFAVLLIEAGLKHAIQIAKNILKAVESEKIRELDSPVSINIGLAGFGFFNINTKTQLLKAADKALHKAKDLDKGVICVFKGKEIQAINHHKPAKGNGEKQLVIKGHAVIPGLAMGKTFVYKDVYTFYEDIDVYEVIEENLTEELAKIHQAIHKVKTDLAAMREIVSKEVNQEHAAIFDVHTLMLDDEELLAEIEKELHERRINAEAVVKEVFKRWENRFRSFENKIFQEKANDIADLGRRVLFKLKGIETNLLSDIPKGSVIITKNLLPSDTVHLKQENVNAIVTQEGSIISHSAILARRLGVPFVTGLGRKIHYIPHDTEILVDGNSGKIIIYPTSKEKKEFEKKIKEQESAYQLYLSSAEKEERLVTGKEPIYINANIVALEDVAEAAKAHADGIGLYRIEHIYLQSSIMPDETYLYNKLYDNLQPMKDKEIVLRLLDIGYDKQLPYMHIEDAANSALGLRGIRVLLRFPQLLETQLSTCCRLSKDYKIKVLIPMVTLLDDVVTVKKRLAAMLQALRSKKPDLYPEKLPVGAMIETPASYFIIDEIINEADFLSIGTNDLVQYTMAADRENMHVAGYYVKGNEIVLPYLEQIIQKARQAEIDCSICGELAGDLSYTERLLKIGLRNFSVAPHVIPHLKYKLKTLLPAASA